IRQEAAFTSGWHKNRLSPRRNGATDVNVIARRRNENLGAPLRSSQGYGGKAGEEKTLAAAGKGQEVAIGIKKICGQRKAPLQPGKYGLSIAGRSPERGIAGPVVGKAGYRLG